MYTVAVSREFVAQHFLTVPDPGPEGELHSHVYTADLRLRGSELGAYGYLVDIDDAEAAMDAVAGRYRDATLNDLPEFEGLNPSVEHFSRLFADRVLDRIDAGTVEACELRMGEDDVAWAAHGREL